MTELSGASTVREIVGRCPQTRPVFERHGIDYCCGGGRPLAAVAREKDVDLEALLGELHSSLEAPAAKGPPVRDWYAAPVGDLADHIINRHHTFMHRELPRLAALLCRVLAAHGERHGHVLAQLLDTYETMDGKLSHHLFTEEEVVFPLIRRAAAGDRSEPLAPHFEHLETEHEAAGATIERMRALTSGYRPPDDACPSFVALYEGLHAMESDLHEHVHLENNILFPRARSL